MLNLGERIVRWQFALTISICTGTIGRNRVVGQLRGSCCLSEYRFDFRRNRVPQKAGEAGVIRGRPTSRSTNVLRDGDSIAGEKIMSGDVWLAARPRRLEDISTIFAESFLGRQSLRRIQTEA